MQVGNALSHTLPGQRSFRMAFQTTIDPEIFGIIHGHFRSQNTAHGGISLVVEFDGVVVVAVFDTDSLLAAFAITDDLGRYLARDLAIAGEFLAQEAHHIRTAEAGEGVMDP